MAQEYDAPGVAEQRLSRTIVFYDKKPYLAIYTRGNTFVLYKSGSPGKAFQEVNYTDDKFSLDFPSLGFINNDRGCWFLSRLATRRTRHGLCTENLSVGRGPEYDYCPSPQSLIFGKDLENVIRNKYPDQKTSLEKIRESSHYGSAFDREFAFVVDADSQAIQVWYRETQMGFVSRNDEVVLLDTAATSVFQKQYEYKKFPMKIRG